MEIVSSEKIITVNTKSVKVEKEQLVISYNGKQYSFDWKNLSKKLAAATQKQREAFIVSPSGYGIHWPDIDEDISIHTLLVNRA